jgi:hypothetical protein
MRDGLTSATASAARIRWPGQHVISEHTLRQVSRQSSPVTYWLVTGTRPREHLAAGGAGGPDHRGEP